MLQTMIESERDQLLHLWGKRVGKSPDWILTPIFQVERTFEANQGNHAALERLIQRLRRFHDKLGFKAKHSLKEGGLCAGAIFRTQRFIETQPRSGAKTGPEKTVHIEHTVPITILEDQIKKRRFSNYTETLAWLLKHSVATALHQQEEELLRKRSKETGALNPASIEYNKPFMRYEKLHGANGVVWNVFDREQVDPDRFTFDDHLGIVLRILKEVGAGSAMLERIRCSPSIIGP